MTVIIKQSPYWAFYSYWAFIRPKASFVLFLFFWFSFSPDLENDDGDDLYETDDFYGGWDISSDYRPLHFCIRFLPRQADSLRCQVLLIQ